MKRMTLISLIVVIMSIALTSAESFAGHKGDISCDSGWQICLQSAMYSSSGIPIVSTVVTPSMTLDLGSSSATEPAFELLIDPISGNVLAKNMSSGSTSVVGQITEPVGSDLHYAFSRDMRWSQEISAQTDTKDGGDTTVCEKNEVIPFVKECTQESITVSELTLTQNGNVIAAFQGKTYTPLKTWSEPSL